MTTTDKNSKLLEVKDLKTYFYTEEGVVKAVDGVSFNIYEDEVLGLVGETGCGKSVTALSLLRLVRAPGEIEEGKVIFNGLDLLSISEKKMRKFRGNDITMIFQDPLNSLNPVMTVGTQIGEVFELHQKDEIQRQYEQKLNEWHEKQEEIKKLEKKLKDETLSDKRKTRIEKKIERLEEETYWRPTRKRILRQKSKNILEEVGIANPEGILDRYPHELSGGMRQRVMISMALSCNPALLIADEPTTALDVTIQAQILDLMKELKDKFNTSIMMITHDLGIIAEMCDRVAVMYSGNIVETAPAAPLFKDPKHPYTKGLIAAIPKLDSQKEKLETIRGSVPNLIYPPKGCRFHPRCDERMEVCDEVKPKLKETEDNHFVACHLFDPKYNDSPKYQWEKEELEQVKKV